MDYYNRLFDEIGFWDIGRESFLKLHERKDETEFSQAFNRSLEEYEKGDEAFGEFIAGFAEKIKVPVEMLNLYIYIRMSRKTLEEYRRRGIDEAVFYETMKDLHVGSRYYYEKAGIYGILQTPHRPWLRLHLGNRLYRFGRLQFEIIESAYDTEIGGRIVKKGDTCLTTHIPRYEKLGEAECEESYARAREFFKEHYGMASCVFFCDSWIMHPWLSECLPADSRIVRYQSKYKILETAQDVDTVVNYVFGEKQQDAQSYAEDTQLRRIAKERIINNLPLGVAVGVRV